ncbi:hypothetical protein BH20BAC1_BH20BAC1_21040 [soil metagenome]
MGWILFIIYFLLFCLLIYRFTFFKNSGIDLNILLLLFIIRIGVSFFNSYINLEYYPLTDIRAFHQEGLIEYHLLFEDPGEYIINLFRSNYHNYGGFTESTSSFWNDTRTNIIAKILSLFNLLSGGNFYVNTLFFNFLIFLSSVLFFRLFRKATNYPEWVIIVGLFLLPSTVYFTSGIHREGFIFIAISIIFFLLYDVIENKQADWKNIFIIVMGFLFILLLRYFVFVSLFLAIIPWVIFRYLLVHRLRIYVISYAVAVTLFFATAFLPDSYNLPLKVSTKQAEFMEISLYGTSTISTEILHPDIVSFAKNLPQALNHSFLRPYITEHSNILYLPLCIEILCYNLLLGLFFIFPLKKNDGVFPGLQPGFF